MHCPVCFSDTCPVFLTHEVMARGRGRGRGGAQGGRGAAQTERGVPQAGTARSQAGEATEHEHDKCRCGMCESTVNDSAIGCDRCNAWFCPSEMCTGLPDMAIALISSLRDDNSVLFVCTGCRVNPGSGAWSETPSTRSKRGGKEKDNENETTSLKQLYMTVKALTSELAKLSAKLDAATKQRSTSFAQANGIPTSQSIQERQSPALSSHDFPVLPPPAPGGDRVSTNMSYRKAIREEVLEVREREKRRSSVVIKGLSARTPETLATEFAEMTSVMMGCRVSLTDIVKIKDHPELCRGKIMDSEQRALVLDKAKTLKGSQYDHVYIRRDLTFNQRQELKARRELPASRVFRASAPQPKAAENKGESDTTQEQASSRVAAKSQLTEHDSDPEPSASSNSPEVTDQRTSEGQSGSGKN